LNKPVIRITKTKIHPDDLASGMENHFRYTLFLPYEPYGPEYPNNKQFGNLSSGNPCDCLAAIICHGVEIGGIMELGQWTIWNGEDYELIEN